MKISETFAETNKTIVRDMTEEELAQREKDMQELRLFLENQEKIANENAAKREAALAKLQALGLDMDDLKALGL
jgi:uncharacterized protein Smg (DUF494 family)